MWLLFLVVRDADLGKVANEMFFRGILELTVKHLHENLVASLILGAGISLNFTN